MNISYTEYEIIGITNFSRHFIVVTDKTVRYSPNNTPDLVLLLIRIDEDWCPVGESNTRIRITKPTFYH